jgi:hypothetical protein
VPTMIHVNIALYGGFGRAVDTFGVSFVMLGPAGIRFGTTSSAGVSLAAGWGARSPARTHRRRGQPRASASSSSVTLRRWLLPHRGNWLYRPSRGREGR